MKGDWIQDGVTPRGDSHILDASNDCRTFLGVKNRDPVPLRVFERLLNFQKQRWYLDFLPANIHSEIKTGICDGISIYFNALLLMQIIISLLKNFNLVIFELAPFRGENLGLPGSPR